MVSELLKIPFSPIFCWEKYKLKQKCGEHLKEWWKKPYTTVRRWGWFGRKIWKFFFLKILCVICIFYSIFRFFVLFTFRMFIVSVVGGAVYGDESVSGYKCWNFGETLTESFTEYLGKFPMWHEPARLSKCLLQPLFAHLAHAILGISHDVCLVTFHRKWFLRF